MLFGLPTYFLGLVGLYIPLKDLLISYK